MGAKNIRIFFGGELLFNGDIDKGCGNQVFDYSKHIVFSKENEHSVTKNNSKTGLSLHTKSPSPSNSEQSVQKCNSRVSPGISPGIPSPSSGEGSHHVFRNISRSSQSSASSSGSLNSGKIRGHSEDRISKKDVENNGLIRSETRNLVKSSISSIGASSDTNIPISGKNLNKINDIHCLKVEFC